MQIVRFKVDDRTRYGVLEGSNVVESSGAPGTLFRRGRRRVPVKQAVLLAPTLPSKIVGVSFNYHARAAELGQTVPHEARFFLKPASALVGPDDPIIYPPDTQRVEH